MAHSDWPLTKNSLKGVWRWLSDLSTMSNRCTYERAVTKHSCQTTATGRSQLRQNLLIPCVLTHQGWISAVLCSSLSWRACRYFFASMLLWAVSCHSFDPESSHEGLFIWESAPRIPRQSDWVLISSYCARFENKLSYETIVSVLYCFMQCWQYYCEELDQIALKPPPLWKDKVNVISTIKRIDRCNIFIFGDVYSENAIIRFLAEITPHPF